MRVVVEDLFLFSKPHTSWPLYRLKEPIMSELTSLGRAAMLADALSALERADTDVTASLASEFQIIEDSRSLQVFDAENIAGLAEAAVGSLGQISESSEEHMVEPSARLPENYQEIPKDAYTGVTATECLQPMSHCTRIKDMQPKTNEDFLRLKHYQDYEDNTLYAAELERGTTRWESHIIFTEPRAPLHPQVKDYATLIFDHLRGEGDYSRLEPYSDRMYCYTAALEGLLDLIHGGRLSYGHLLKTTSREQGHQFNFAVTNSSYEAIRELVYNYNNRFTGNYANANRSRVNIFCAGLLFEKNYMADLERRGLLRLFSRHFCSTQYYFPTAEWHAKGYTKYAKQKGGISLFEAGKPATPPISPTAPIVDMYLGLREPKPGQTGEVYQRQLLHLLLLSSTGQPNDG